MNSDEAMKVFGEAFEAYHQAAVLVPLPGTSNDWGVDVEAGIEAAATVIQQAFAERDGEIAMLTEALRGCGRAVEGGAKEPRANVRFIVGETLQALAAKGDSRD